MVGLDASIVNVLLPQIRSDYGVSVQEAASVGTIYLAMLASLGLPLGRCSDLFSANRVFLSGILLFGLGSLACGLAPTLALLLAARALQGLGGAMLASSMGAVVFSNINPDARGKVLGGAIAVMSLGSVIGPPVGGFFAHHSHWSWAFFINVPLCAIAFLALLPYGLRPSEPTTRFDLSRLDLPGSALSALTLLALPAALSTMGEKGLGDLSFLLLLSLAVGAFAGLSRVEKLAPHPLLPARLFSWGHETRVCLLKVLLYAAFSGVMLVYPFFISSRPNLDPANVGWLLLACALSLALVTPLAGFGVDRYGARAVNLAGGVTLLLTALASLRLGATPSNAQLVLTLAGYGAGAALLMTASSVALLNLAKPAETGVFSALNSLCSPVGGAIGFALFSAVYGEPHGAAEQAKSFLLSGRALALLAFGILGLAAAIPKLRPLPTPHPTAPQEEP